MSKLSCGTQKAQYLVKALGDLIKESTFIALELSCLKPIAVR
jgi:hypothetical protein